MIIPDWPAPSRVKAASTLRCHEADPIIERFNVALHVEDDAQVVKANRAQLQLTLALGSREVAWLNQTHGTHIQDLDRAYDALLAADASTTTRTDYACCVMTADCLPVILTDKGGTRVASAHAGWRGLCAGILEQSVARFDVAESVIAWLGPAIGPTQFEVGHDVYQAFTDNDPADAEAFVWVPDRERWLADLYRLAKNRLRRSGVKGIYGGDYCTMTETERFFSYRRDAAQAGRMATLIWLDD